MRLHDRCRGTSNGRKGDISTSRVKSSLEVTPWADCSRAEDVCANLHIANDPGALGDDLALENDKTGGGRLRRRLSSP